MISARKYIAKCRQRGYDDEKIRRAVAGKTPALREAVLSMLETAAVVEVEAVLEGCNDAELDSVVLEVEAVAEAMTGEGASANDGSEAATAEVVAAALAEAAPTEAVYAEGEAVAMTPEDIDDLPPADVFAEAEALEAELGGAEVACAESEMQALAGDAPAETAAAPNNEAMPEVEGIKGMEAVAAPEAPEIAEAGEEAVVAEEVDAVEESPVAEVAEAVEVAEVADVPDVPENAPEMDEFVEDPEIAESAPEMDEAAKEPETISPAQAATPADLHLTIEEEIFLPENWLDDDTAESAASEEAA
ncbi:MAG: hypothetical protein J6333_07090, partial [Planctomycetes bacterium]|nr:hypothetical protein [Planctomycetota bacterium]